MAAARLLACGMCTPWTNLKPKTHICERTNTCLWRWYEKIGTDLETNTSSWFRPIWYLKLWQNTGSYLGQAYQDLSSHDHFHARSLYFIVTQTFSFNSSLIYYLSFPVLCIKYWSTEAVLWKSRRSMKNITAAMRESCALINDPV